MNGLDLTISRFYQTETSFSNFENITEERIEEIKKETEIRNSRCNSDSRFIHCINTMRFLLSQTKTTTFDERVAFLINTVDPELEAFEIFKNASITSKKAVTDAKTKEEKEALLLKRKTELNQFMAEVRNAIGFYDSKLLRYEHLYSKKFETKINKTK